MADTDILPASSRSLRDAAPELDRLLKWSVIRTPSQYAPADIEIRTIQVPMRDGILLATDLYLPPKLPAPTVVMRTPYGRAVDGNVGFFVALARRGYVVVSQDCRGTGDSQPDTWDYYMYEPDDGYDLIDWISGQDWFDGFIGSCGGSYVGQTQWHMSTHPNMSTIIPEVSGLGVAVNTAHLYMFLNAYAYSVGKGDGRKATPITEMEKVFERETMAGGYFNEPLHQPLPPDIVARYPMLRDLPPMDAKRWLWEHYCSRSCAERAAFVRDAFGVSAVSTLEVEALPGLFGHQISHDRHTLPHPRMDELCSSLHAPVLFRTGWYDWGLNDALATWELLMRAAPEPMRTQCRLFIGPSAHNVPGYHEGMDRHPELHHAYGTTTNSELLLQWYEAVRTDQVDTWPTVIYYLMGANEWRVAQAWPPPDARVTPLYLAADGTLAVDPPTAESGTDSYTYDPTDPTPTVGGSIVSFLYPPGSVDVSEVQRRADVLSYTTGPLDDDLDVVGPLRLVLYASSTATDTDFVGRLSDVFPDGRAIQLQSGILRARYRDIGGAAELLHPGEIYQLEIDLWATANRFAAGHRLRVDISSADFPHYDRNANLGGEPGEPLPAVQTIYRDADHPSHLLLPTIPGS